MVCDFNNDAYIAHVLDAACEQGMMCQAVIEIGGIIGESRMRRILRDYKQSLESREELRRNSEESDIDLNSYRLL